MITFFLIIFWGAEPVIDLNPFEFYDPYDASEIYRFHDKWLVCSRTQAALYLINDQGQVDASFKNSGKGPGELERPWVLGVFEDYVLVCSFHGPVLKFGDRLVLQDSILPKFPNANFWRQAQAFDEHDFLVFNQGGFDFNVYRYTLTDNKWSLAGQYFEQTLDFSRVVQRRASSAESSSAFFDGKTAFFQPKGYQEPYYEVHVIDFSNYREDQRLAVLAAPLEAFEPYYRGFYAFIDRAAVLPEGYLVEVRTQERGNKVILHDYFNTDGRLVKRQRQDGTKLLPVKNGPEIFLWREIDGRPVLEHFQPHFPR